MGRVKIQTIELIGSQSLNIYEMIESAVHRLDGSGLLNLEQILNPDELKIKSSPT